MKTETSSTKKSFKVSAMVLAAGSSRRMGVVNKLLTAIEGVPLVSAVTRAALASRVDSVWVVTGYEAQAIQRALTGETVTFVHNSDFATGIASSLRVGLKALPADCDGVVILLGDMPFVESGQINRLIDAFEQSPNDAIVVPYHGGRPGNPRLWARAHFEAMCRYEGDMGPKDLLRKLSASVTRVAMNDAQVLTDIDTPMELARFNGTLPEQHLA